MTRALSTSIRAAALGLAAGGRASSVATALSASGHRVDPSWLASSWTRRTSQLLSLGEVIADKLPITPSRLEPPGLVPRIVVGAVGGVVLARRDGQGTTARFMAALVGGVAALAGSHLGAHWRSSAAAKLHHDAPGAWAEDAAVGALATFAVRPGR